MRLALSLALLVTASRLLAAESYLRTVGTNLFDFSPLLSANVTANSSKFIVRGTVQTNTKYGTYVLDAKLRVSANSPNLYGSSRTMLLDLAAANMARGEITPGAWYAMSPELRSRLTPYWEKRHIIVSNFPSVLSSKDVLLFAVPNGQVTIRDIAGVSQAFERFDYGKPFNGKLTEFSVLNRVTTNDIVRARIPTEREIEEDKAAAARRLLSWRLLQATNGLPSYQNEVAMMYLNGDGLASNRDTALHWLRAAATNQHGPSIIKLKELTASDTKRE